MVVMFLPVVTTGCATSALNNLGRSYEAVTNYDGVYLYRDYLVVGYTAQRFTSATNSQSTVELKRCVFVRLTRDQPPPNTGNSIRNSEVPAEIRKNGKELPLVIVDLPARTLKETPESAAPAPLYVYVGRRPNTQLNTFWICRTNALGEHVCTPVDGLNERQSGWAKTALCFGFPLTIAVDVATAPIWIPAAVWFAHKYRFEF